MASYGHVRDLVPKEGAVDPTRNFAMRWELIDKNKKHVDAISRAMKKADALYLSTDPDREGEAISWHLYQLLKDSGALDGKSVHRSVFYEITKNAVQEAVDNPREIADELVKAYLARRALDFLVGFNHLAAAVEEGRAFRCFGGSRAEPGAAHDLRARGGDPRVQAARILDHRCAGRKRRAAVHGEADRARRNARSSSSRSSMRPVPMRHAGRSSRQRRARWWSRASTRSSASATRRRRSRPRPCSRKPHASSASARSARCAPPSACMKASISVKARLASSLICAPTPSISVSRRFARSARSSSASMAMHCAARRAAHLQDQIEERAGGARSRAANIGGAYSRATRRQARCRRTQALHADLAPGRGEPDGSGRLRHGRGRPGSRRRQYVPREWLDTAVRWFPRRVPRKHRRRRAGGR